jgi:hypothetical protein
MGFFESLPSSSFKIDADGRRLFYPFGLFGAGDVVPSPEEYERLREKKSNWSTGMLCVAAVLPVFSLPLFFASGFIVVIIMLFYGAWVDDVTRGLERAAKLTFHAALMLVTRRKAVAAP